MPIEGSCYCGAVKLQVSAALRPPINCHCGQCRSLSGSAFTTWITIKRSEAQVVGEDMIASFCATPNVERYFCKRCGTHVYTQDKRMLSVYGIPAGLLRGEDVLPPRADYYVSDKATWYTLAQGSRCFSGGTGTEPMESTTAR